MIYWNRDAIQWQADDTVMALRGFVRESGNCQAELAALAKLEDRLAMALDSLANAIEEINALESLSYQQLRAKLTGAAEASLPCNNC